MPFLFLIQFFLFFYCTFRCFFTIYWHKNITIRIFLTIFPLLFGWLNIFIICQILSAEDMHQYHSYIFSYIVLTLLSILPQWYKLIWSFLQQINVAQKSDGQRLFLALFFASLMIIAIILFFTFYYLWIDALSGFTQGLRSALLYYQPILLNWPTAFYFSFVTYFTLGYGDLIPYGGWFHFLVFLECIISLLNTGIIVIYIYNLFISRK